jgi:hypothetical protein
LDSQHIRLHTKFQVQLRRLPSVFFKSSVCSEYRYISV